MAEVGDSNSSEPTSIFKLDARIKSDDVQPLTDTRTTTTKRTTIKAIGLNCIRLDKTPTLE